ncbi:MAG: TonB-dependent receptor [Pseudomonadota bacterium]
MGPLPSPSKKYSKISLLTLFASAIALGAALPVAAQESNSDVEEGVEEIIVQGRINFFRPDDQSSATGFALPIVDTPQAVTVLTEDLLDVAGIDSIGLATRLIPGVVSTLEGQAGAPSEVFSRGFINNDRDGYRLNGASFSRFVELDLAGVERIESVRGPSAIVFGQNSFGGILNVVTKKPTSDFRYGGAISTGTYQNVRIEGDVSGALTDSVRGRLTASYTDADSWTDGLENESMAFFPSLEVDLGPNTLLSLTGFHQRTDNTPYSGFGLVIDGEGNVSTPDTIGIQPDLFFGFNADGNVAESEATYIGATLDHEFSADMSGSVTLSYNRPDVDSQSIIVVGSIDPAADPITLVTFGQTFDETFEVFEIDVSFDWTFELFGNEQLISIRADYEDLENEETATRALTSPTLGVFPFNLSDPSANPASVDPLSLIPTFPSVDFDLASEESIEEFGFGAQVLLNPIDRLTILAGARYDKINRDVSLTRRLRAPDTVETTSIETDNISPQAWAHF